MDWGIGRGGNESEGGEGEEEEGEQGVERNSVSLSDLSTAMVADCMRRVGYHDAMQADLEGWRFHNIRE